MDKEIPGPAINDSRDGEENKAQNEKTEDDKQNESESRTTDTTNNIMKESGGTQIVNSGDSSQKTTSQENELKDKSPDLSDRVKQIFSLISEKCGSDSSKSESKDECMHTMYISKEKKLYHASVIPKSSANTISVITNGETVYQIKPVEGAQLSELVFELFKLIDDEPIGLFTICKDGNFIKEEQKDEVRSEEKKTESENINGVDQLKMEDKKAENQIEKHNSTIAWSQVQDPRGGGLCTGLATQSHKKDHATETRTKEQNTGLRVEASQKNGHKTYGSQPQPGTDISIPDILRPKTTVRVGCWNVRTLYQTGKIAQVIREMHNYNIGLLGVSETRWVNSGTRQLADGHQIMYSGRTDDQHNRV